MTRVLVIGATGTVGREVVLQLAAQNVAVRAMARNPQAAALPAHVEVVQGDLTVPETLDRCLAGIDSIFLVWTAPPAAIAPALERILKRERRIVFLSSPYKTYHPMFQQPNPARGIHAQIEQAIESSCIEWTFLRPGMFATNALTWWAPQIRKGNVVRWPFASVPTAPIDPRDIAAVAVRSLCEDGHSGNEYVMTGPQSLSHSEQVQTIAQAINRSLHFEEISPDEARSELLAIMPAPAIEMLLSAWATAAVGHPAFMASTVAEVTGNPPRAFIDWARDHTAEFRLRT